MDRCQMMSIDRLPIDRLWLGGKLGLIVRWTDVGCEDVDGLSSDKCRMGKAIGVDRWWL